MQQIFVHACNFWDLCLTTYTADLCSHMHHLKSLFDNICSTSLFTHATFEISVWQHIQQTFVHASNFWDLCLTTYTADLCSCMQLLRSLFDNIYSRSLFTHAPFEFCVSTSTAEGSAHAHKRGILELCLWTSTAESSAHTFKPEILEIPAWTYTAELCSCT